MIGISPQNLDILLERICPECKEIFVQKILNGFVVKDDKSRFSPDTWEWLRRYSDACFEEEHKCKEKT